MRTIPSMDSAAGAAGPDRAVRLIDRADRDQAARVASTDWLAYERPLPQVVALLAPHRSGAFYDVGANTGFYSVLLGRFSLVPAVRCFEPVPSIAQMCRENLAANLVLTDVHELAVQATAGTVTLFLPPADHGLIETSASLLPDFKESVASSMTVRATSLDAFNADADSEDVGFIKVDVEGAEDRVLAGAHAITSRCRPYFAVELLPRARWDEVQGFLQRHSYGIIPLRASGDFQTRTQAVFVPDGHNQLLVPEELVPETEALLGSLHRDRTIEEAQGREDPLRTLRIDAGVDRRNAEAWMQEARRAQAALAECRTQLAALAAKQAKPHRRLLRKARAVLQRHPQPRSR